MENITKELNIGEEYFIYFHNYYCTGFVLKVEEGILFLHNGHYYRGSHNGVRLPIFEEKDMIQSFNKAQIDIRKIYGIAQA